MYVAIAIDMRDTDVAVAALVAVDPYIVVDARGPHAIATVVFLSHGILAAVATMALKPRILSLAAAIGGLDLAVAAAMLPFVTLGELSAFGALRTMGLVVSAAIIAAIDSLTAPAAALSLGDMAGMVLIAASPAALRVGLGR
jgi:hypothetical protein